MASNVYFDPNFDIEAVKIVPGEYCATCGAKLIVTVLGSCVAACISDCRNGIGGMNHFMLPNVNDPVKPNRVFTHSGIVAMENLINQLLLMGAQRQNLEAKVFGGGNILNVFNAANAGASSSKFLHEYLAAEKIPIVAKDVLDIYPRKVYFFPDTGRALVKKLRKLHNETIIQREHEYAIRLGLLGGEVSGNGSGKAN